MTAGPAAAGPARPGPERPDPARPDPLPTRLTALTGIRYPIVQTGMGFVAGAKLAAATSRAGGLGIIGSATMTMDALRTAVAEVMWSELLAVQKPPTSFPSLPTYSSGL